MNFDELFNMTKTVYQNTLEPIALTDEELGVVWANAQAEKRFPAALLRGGIAELLSRYDRPKVMEILQSGRAFTGKKVFEPLNTVSVRFVPVVDGEKLLGCQVFFDCGQEQNEKEAPESPEKMIASFSGEYKTPLTVIFSALGLLARRLEQNNDDVTKAYLKLITQNSYKLLRLSNNLAEVAKYRSGVAALNPKTGDLCSFTDGLCGAAAILTKSIGVPLSCTVPDERIETVFDPERLAVVFYNLFSNSCKYTRDGNRITVKLEKKGKKAVVTVADKGEGIKGGNIEKIFEPYYSFKNDCPVAGAGLGLSIVKYVITQHGGTIALQSHEGEGTTVAFTLPIKESDGVALYTAANPVDYLSDRFSSLFVEMSDVCGCPLP